MENTDLEKGIEEEIETPQEVEEIQDTSNDDGIDEALGLNRHPHVDEDDEEAAEEVAADTDEEAETESDDAEDAVEETEADSEEPKKEEPAEVKCPNVNCTFHLKFKEGEKCVNCGFTFNKENMAEFENIDLHEESNDEFENGITETPTKLTPAQSLKRQAEYRERIEKAKERLEVLEPIAELSKSTGFEKLLDEVKASIHRDVDKNDTKDAKNGIKDQDAVILVAGLVADLSSEYRGKKRDIKDWEAKIIELKGSQLSLLDDAQPVNEELTEEQKTELAASAEPCQEDCTSCDEVECANNPIEPTDDGSAVLDEAIQNEVENTSTAA